MASSLNAAVAALHAFGQKLGLTAGNIASLNTGGYPRGRATSREGPHGAAEVAAPRHETGSPPGRLEEGRQPVQKFSNAALEEEIPELMPSVYGFRANLKTVKAQDEMLGHLLDTVV